jgi:hypothetical protein
MKLAGELLSRVVDWGERVLAKVWPERRYKDLAILLDAYNSPSCSREVLYLGDSVLLRTSHTDTDSSPLWQMVSDRLAPAYETCCICARAYNPQIYHHMLNVLSVTLHRPRLVIVSVNLRCFSPQWDFNPEWQFSRELQILESFIARRQESVPGAVTGPTNRVTTTGHTGSLQEANEAFRQIPVQYVGTPFNRVGDFLEVIESTPKSEIDKLQRSRTIFTFHYAYKLTAENRKLCYLKSLIGLTRALGMSLIIYFTPINYIAGEKLLGRSFSEILSSNLATLKAEVEDAGTVTEKGGHRSTWDMTVVDLSCTLSPEHFFHENDPTEHLNENGRRSLADILSEVAGRRLRQLPSNGSGEPF